MKSEYIYDNLKQIDQIIITCKINLFLLYIKYF